MADRDNLADLRAYLFIGVLPGHFVKGDVCLKLVDNFVIAGKKLRKRTVTKTSEEKMAEYEVLATKHRTDFNVLYESAVELVRQDKFADVLECLKKDITNPRVSWHAEVGCLAAMLHCQHGSKECRTAVYAALPAILLDSTMLFFFLQAHKLAAPQSNKCGWGRGLRRAVRNWYFLMSPERLLLELWHRPRRHGWSHKDVMKLAHLSRKALPLGSQVVVQCFFSNLQKTKEAFAAEKEAARFIGLLDRLYNKQHENDIPHKRLEALLEVEDGNRYCLVREQDPLLKWSQVFPELFPRLSGSAVTRVVKDSEFLRVVATPVNFTDGAGAGGLEGIRRASVREQMENLQIGRQFADAEPVAEEEVDVLLAPAAENVPGAEGTAGGEALARGEAMAADATAADSETETGGEAPAAQAADIVPEVTPEEPPISEEALSSTQILRERLKQDDVVEATDALSAVAAMNAFIRRVKHTRENIKGRNVWRNNHPTPARQGLPAALQLAIPKHLNPILDRLDRIVLETAKRGAGESHLDLVVVVEPNSSCNHYIDTELGRNVYKQMKGIQAILITLLNLCYIDRDDLGGFGDRVTFCSQEGGFLPYALPTGDLLAKTKALKAVCTDTNLDQQVMSFDKLKNHCCSVEKKRLVFIGYTLGSEQIVAASEHLRESDTENGIKRIVLIGLCHSVMEERKDLDSRLLVVNGFNRRSIHVLNAFLDGDF